MKMMDSHRFQTVEFKTKINLKTTIRILNEIHALKQKFPHIKIAVREAYQELKIFNIKEHYLIEGHEIELKFVDFSWSIVNHEIPDLINFPCNFSSLINCVNTYSMTLDHLEGFYTNLNTLDTICIIAEPQKITPKITWRLIKYSSKLFLKIEFMNPLAGDVSVSFHGRTDEVIEKTEIWKTKCEDSDDSYQQTVQDIYRKILSVYDIPYFPVTDEDEIECSICMSYLDEKHQVPLVCCDSAACDSIFHVSCMEKYFELNNCVSVLSILYGSCPFCKQKLSTSYAPILHQKGGSDVVVEDKDESMDLEMLI